jgi:hypothetical protein
MAEIGSVSQQSFHSRPHRQGALPSGHRRRNLCLPRQQARLSSHRN